MSKQPIVAFWIAAIVFGIAGGLLPGADSTAQAQQGKTVSLRDRLVFGLKARRPSEVQFLENVATQVQMGNIPQKLVDESFFWVRKNKPYDRYPFIYFERILRLRGKAANVPIPAYNGPYKSPN